MAKSLGIPSSHPKPDGLLCPPLGRIPRGTDFTLCCTRLLASRRTFPRRCANRPAGRGTARAITCSKSPRTRWLLPPGGTRIHPPLGAPPAVLRLPPRPAHPPPRPARTHQVLSLAWLFHPGRVAAPALKGGCPTRAPLFQAQLLRQSPFQRPADSLHNGQGVWQVLSLARAGGTILGLSRGLARHRLPSLQVNMPDPLSYTHATKQAANPSPRSQHALALFPPRLNTP